MCPSAAMIPARFTSDNGSSMISRDWAQHAVQKNEADFLGMQGLSLLN
jgi:hypothetical protein